MTQRNVIPADRNTPYAEGVHNHEQGQKPHVAAPLSAHQDQAGWLDLSERFGGFERSRPSWVVDHMSHVVTVWRVQTVQTVEKGPVRVGP